AKMQSPQITVVVPPGLEDVLEAVTRAVIEKNPDNMIEFFALYFQELVSFQKEHTNLDITELVEKFELISENGDEGLEETTPEFSGESKQRDMCTDPEEDPLLEEPAIQYSSKETQYPSVPSSMAGSKSLPGSDGAPSPAAHELSRSDSFCSVRDVATSVQTLHGDSQTSEGECTPVESAAEDASVSAAGASVESVRSQP
ncbi:CABYR protein, partial [Hemiprocne comata]|nr:CABYR protein [Hemiprocne comata]